MTRIGLPQFFWGRTDEIWNCQILELGGEDQVQLSPQAGGPSSASPVMNIESMIKLFSDDRVTKEGTGSPAGRSLIFCI